MKAQLLLLLAALPALPLSSRAATSGPLDLPGPGSVWDWKVRPQVGARYEMRIFNRSWVQYLMPDVNGRAVRFGLDQVDHTVLDYRVLSRDVLGATTISVTLRAFRGSSVLSPFRPQDDPSAAQALGRAGSKLGVEMAGLKAVEGARLQLKISPSGKVWSIVGLEQLRARLRPSRRSGLDPGLAQLLSASLSGESPGFYGHLAEETPEHPVSVGDSWDYSLELPVTGSGPLSISGTSRLVARARGVATVKESTRFDQAIDPPSLMPGAASTSGIKVTGRLRGESSGASTIDEATGLTRESTSTIIMHGRMTVSISASRGAKAPRRPSPLP